MIRCKTAKIRERINFIKTCGSDIQVAAVVASSRSVVRDVVKFLPKDLHAVIECGPGDGVLTGPLLMRMHPEGKLLAIESNKEFADALMRMSDPRLSTVRGRAERITDYAERLGFGSIDAVCASIPFLFLTPAERRSFVQNAYKLLHPQGTLVIFHQYSPLMRREMKAVFGNATMAFEMRNLPPCFIMVAQKEN